MQDLFQSLSPACFSDLSLLHRQRARLQWPPSFDAVDEPNSLSFDSLPSLPISLQPPRTDKHVIHAKAIGSPEAAGFSLNCKKGGASKKRKAGKSPRVKFNEEAEKRKRTKGGGSPESSKETGAPPPPTSLLQDFIHVRARRGQATDSHSLAERVRRERISEKMKYLQALVPGCDKITGKAGMLEEIINYVQSLQRQVEFLSMKLATANPWADFNIDSFFPKEEIMNVPQVGLSPEMVDSYFPTNSIHQIAASCGVNMNSSVSDLELTLRRSLGSTISISDIFFDTSFDVDNSSWVTNSESICGADFHQVKGPHSLLGSGPPNNLKMEM